MRTPLIPVIPNNMPRMGNALTRAIGRGMLRLFGWKVVGEIPNEPKLMIAAAPHTSNWDFVLGVGGLLALGLKISAMMKEEAFFWPCKGLFMKLGFLPINRSAAQDVVGLMHKEYDAHDKLWLAITPEGTRSKVPRWKTGFLRIAKDAGVPVLLVGIDGVKKQIIIDKVVEPTDQYEAQAEELRVYMADTFTGINPHKQ